MAKEKLRYKKHKIPLIVGIGGLGITFFILRCKWFTMKFPATSSSALIRFACTRLATRTSSLAPAPAQHAPLLFPPSAIRTPPSPPTALFMRRFLSTVHVPKNGVTAPTPPPSLVHPSPGNNGGAPPPPPSHTTDNPSYQSVPMGYSMDDATRDAIDFLVWLVNLALDVVTYIWVRVVQGRKPARLHMTVNEVNNIQYRIPLDGFKQSEIKITLDEENKIRVVGKREIQKEPVSYVITLPKGEFRNTNVRFKIKKDGDVVLTISNFKKEVVILDFGERSGGCKIE